MTAACPRHTFHIPHTTVKITQALKDVQSLPYANHSLDILLHSYERNPSDIFFDYAAVSASSNQTSQFVTFHLRTRAELTNILHSVPAVAAAISSAVGGVVFLVAIAFLKLYYCKKNRRIITDFDPVFESNPRTEALTAGTPLFP